MLFPGDGLNLIIFRGCYQPFPAADGIFLNQGKMAFQRLGHKNKGKTDGHYFGIHYPFSDYGSIR